ncbi:DotU family type VI secretion system protein [Delftia sp. PS-11]|uniref:DotU family type VI secretion system protein n=1 Tax=Delftia sp. PS-11 TaxID=2767222 RepID=UPI0024571F13|nr:DotU family type VI secretion system protein [Delftia sp. PS-11]KAJ8743919.1 DotU family type VI secretion system protein [Delftia sp. PS-11]
MNSSTLNTPSPWPEAPQGAAPGTPPGIAIGTTDSKEPSSQGPLRSLLPDVVSGGNPLVAAANQLLNLIPQIRAMVTNQDPRALQQMLLEHIRDFEQRAGASGVPMETIIGARYCICTVLDETAAQTPWGSEGVWPRHSLLVALHNETWGGEKFFQLLARLVQTPGQHIDLIELLYFCIMLGFEGRYRVIDNGASQLETLKARLLQLIESTRGDRSSLLSAHWRGVQRIAAAPWTMVPLWVAAACTLLLAFAIYLWFSYRLSTSSDDLFAAINEIRFPRTAAAASAAIAKPRLRQFLEPEIREGLVSVRDEADRSTVVLRGDGLFDPASTVVKPRYAQVIHRVAAALDEVPGRVVINGYTDNQPIRTARFPSNWNLSQERAQSVAQMLADSLRDRQRLHAEGRADSDPIASNNTAEGRALNRRVEIVLLVAPQLRDQSLQTPSTVTEPRN